MNNKVINFKEELKLISEQWTLKNIAKMNDYEFKLVKIKGEFMWHNHEDTDKTFIVLDGTLKIDFIDFSVSITEGEMYVVPKGKKHKPYAENSANILLIEPSKPKN